MRIKDSFVATALSVCASASITPDASAAFSRFGGSANARTRVSIRSLHGSISDTRETFWDNNSPHDAESMTFEADLGIRGAIDGISSSVEFQNSFLAAARGVEVTGEINLVSGVDASMPEGDTGGSVDFRLSASFFLDEAQAVRLQASIGALESVLAFWQLGIEISGPAGTDNINIFTSSHEGDRESVSALVMADAGHWTISINGVGSSESSFQPYKDSSQISSLIGLTFAASVSIVPAPGGAALALAAPLALARRRRVGALMTRSLS